MPIYTDRIQAENYWRENIKFKEFHNTQKEMEIMDQKIKDAITNEVLIEMNKESLRWCNQYRLVPKSNGDYRLVVDMPGVNQFMKPIHFKMEGTPTLEQLLMKNDFTISYNLKEAYNHVPVHPTMHDTISGSFIQVSGNALRTKQCTKSIHTNNEKSNSCYQRDLESSVCDLSRRLIDLTSGSTSFKSDCSPDNPVPSISRMDCEFRKIEPNPIKSIQIPGMDVEYLGHVSTTSGREKIQC
jgi:hypothetical protein